MSHPVFSRHKSDRFSLFFVAAGRAWWFRIFGLIGLACALVLGYSAHPSVPFELSPSVEPLAIAVSLAGVLGTWLAAQADAFSRCRRGWQVAVFLLWPLAYWYVWRQIPPPASESAA